MSTPSNPFGSTNDSAGPGGTDGSASRPGMADISEIQTDLLPERQWDKSDVLTDKLPPRPRDISEVETGRLPERSPDITELETGLLRPRPPVVSRPDTLPPAPVAVPVVVPAPVSVPAPASEPDPVPVPVRLFAPTRPAVEISELPTGKLTMPPRPRPGLRPRPRPRPDTGDADDQRERERERKRAELRERGRIRARAATETRELDDVDDSADSAPLPTRRRRRRAWWIAGIAVVLALLALSGGGLVTFSATQGPEAVIQAYCGDLVARDYTSAYDLLSPHARARLTREQFERAGAVRERLDGAATACALADSLPLVGNVAVLNPFAATATITATLRRRRAQTGAVTLVRQDGGAWAIDRIDPSLEGADVTPLLLADTFCGALVAGDFHTAYGLFSAASRHRVSEAEFTQAVKDALSDGGNAKLASCTPDPASYSVKDATASVTANVDTSAGGVPLTLPTTLTFVRAQGGWTIDNFDVTP